MRTYVFHNDEKDAGMPNKRHTYFTNNQEMIAYLKRKGRRPLKIIRNEFEPDRFDVIVSKSILEQWFNFGCSF